MLFLLRMLRARRGRAMDPLHVSMTGVRMGERFLQIGCDDRSLLAGLAAKVGLSGMAAVAAFDEASEKRAAAVGARIGALIEARRIEGNALPFDSDHFDMIVVDDTQGSFGSIDRAPRINYLSEARRVVRSGGRIEVIEAMSRTGESQKDLEAAGFRPVRVLAEKDGFRFVEGLKPNQSHPPI